MKKNRFSKLTICLTSLVIGLITIQACKTYYFRSNYQDANKLLHETQNIQTKPYLKAHLKNGDVCILMDSWQVDTVSNLLTGNGTKYNFNRAKVFEGAISILIDSVAIFETNRYIKKAERGRIIALSIITGINLTIGSIILFKAIFGSCPTFYLDANTNTHYADAEGFSNAISPSMEYHDIDALNHKRITNNTFSITMKNEALETHCVNDVKLLAYPLKTGERVYQSPSDEFYLCENEYVLKQATGNEGDITALLKDEDKQERFSLSDESNLNCKEVIYLTFDKVKNTDNLGLIINFRQTLMTTYFIYSALGYMGDEVSDVFAKIESNDKIQAKLKSGIRKELGDIDIYVWDEQNEIWILQKGFHETGPIAFNRQILPLTTVALKSPVQVKIVLNKGLWRLDYFALTNIKEQVTPKEILPNQILNKGIVDNAALNQINTSDQYLISMPGSEYKFNFLFPASDDYYELFLYSKGYYIEWMREHWIKEKNLMKLKQMVDYPKIYLRKEAKSYKLYETNMEQEFWNSRIDTKTFSYYEN